MSSFSLSKTCKGSQDSPVVTLAVRKIDKNDNEDAAENTNFPLVRAKLEDDAEKFDTEGKDHDTGSSQAQAKVEGDTQVTGLINEDAEREPDFEIKDNTTDTARPGAQTFDAIYSGHSCGAGGTHRVSDNTDKEVSEQAGLTDKRDAFNSTIFRDKAEELGTCMAGERELIKQEERFCQETEKIVRKQGRNGKEKDKEKELISQERSKYEEQDERKEKQGREKNEEKEEHEKNERDEEKERDEEEEPHMHQGNKYQEKDVERNSDVKEGSRGDGSGNEALDGGWAYAVLLGTLVVMVSVGIMTNCFSILFLGFLSREGASSAVIAGIYNTEAFLWSTANLLGGSLVEHFGWRVVGLTGSVFFVIGLGASAFSTSAPYLFFSHSFLSGLGSGMSCLVSYAIIPHYFKRLLGRANAIMTAGICIGGTLGPPVITYLQDEYGYKGATIIITAFLLNNFASALVFHPVAWHRPKQKPTGKSGTPRNKTGEKNLRIDVESDLNDTSELRKCKHVHEENGRTVERKAVTEANNIIPLQTGSEAPGQNSTTISNYDAEGRTTKTNKEPAKSIKNKPDLKTTAKEVFKTLLRNIGVLRYASAVIISAAGAFMIGVYFNTMMMVPFAMEFEGYAQEEASWAVSIFNLCNLISRILVSPLADLPWFSLHWGFIFHSALLAVSVFVFAFVSGLVWINVMLGIIGYAVGSCMCLYPLVMVETMGIDNYMAILGVSGLVIGAWLLASGPLFGVIRDVTGSYRITFCALASTGVIAFILFLFLPASVKHDSAKRKQQERLKQRKEEQEETRGMKEGGER